LGVSNCLAIALALVLATSGAAIARAAAADYPSKPIRIVVPFPPGSGADVRARKIAEPLAKRLGKPLEGVSRRSMDRLSAYPWPGNIRELQNVVERAAILATGPLVEVPLDLLATTEPRAPVLQTLEDRERDHILSVLKGTGGVIEGPRGAAGVLGLHPNTLRSRMKKLGIERLRYGTSS